MKILELRFKNLNSLYGEWFIDFTDPEYVSNGIFALTGPTGAGKSTILDAICLALYGATPRLGKITKSSNEIMSRQTGECFAEVVFESQAGRFRCHWAQHRARKKADAELQGPRHEIADANDEGKVLENQIRRVAEVIEENTGMDFERFTRSILLAQGGFDTFLKADAEQKSKILEQITGTEIYSEISRRVHERQRDERERLNILQAETSGIVILEPEQEIEIQKELDVKQKEETSLSEKLAKTDKAIMWLNNIDQLKNEITNLSVETIKLQSDMEAFKPERDKLGRAIKAATLDGSYASLKSIRKQQLDDQDVLRAEEAALPNTESLANDQTELLKLSEQQTIKAKQELKASAPLIKNVRSLDQTLGEWEKTIKEGKESCNKDIEKIDSYKKARLTELEKRTVNIQSLDHVESYLKEHVQDEWLVSGLAGVEEQLSNLNTKQKEISRYEIDQEKSETALNQAVIKLNEYTKQCDTHKQELVDTSRELQKSKNVLDEILGERLLREYRAEKESLLREMAFLAKIAELEVHRTRLEDGKPCPLCGSEDHPFAEGNVPVPDIIEKKIEKLTKLISKAEDQEVVIRHHEEAGVIAHKKLADSERLEVTAVNDKNSVEKALAELKGSLSKFQSDFAQLKESVSTKLQPLGITEIPNEDVSLLLETLKESLKKWNIQVSKKAEIEKKIADVDSELMRLDAIIETQSDALKDKQERLEKIRREYFSANDERKALYDDKDPDVEELRLNKAVTDADTSEKNVRAIHGKLQQEMNNAKSRIESLRKNIDQRETELENTKSEFLSALESASFLDETQFLEARLTVEHRDTLSAQARALDEGHAGLVARQIDRETRLAAEVSMKVTDKALEDLEPKLKEQQEALKQLRDDAASLKHKLNENAAAKKRIKDKQTAIDAQKKECHRWEKLHGLIGSADGKKFRNFAQGLTFELMVSHANRQLEKMTDRYLLIRDDEAPLELNVIDNYQAGEIRSTRNLSGGESFIVSLTLALGLSKMASRKVRVDSLFLDEGFGTLDEDALETALETLSSLQQDGKLIGVISHVPALKERISTQIQVSPRSGGQSRIQGPGCQVCNG